MFKEHLRVVGDYVMMVTAIAAALGFFIVWMKILAEMWPLFTGLFFIVMTIVGVSRENWLNNVMCVGGLGLYVASWWITSNYGTVIGLSACSVGFTLFLVSPIITPPRVSLCRTQAH